MSMREQPCIHQVRAGGLPVVNALAETFGISLSRLASQTAEFCGKSRIAAGYLRVFADVPDCTLSAALIAAGAAFCTVQSSRPTAVARARERTTHGAAACVDTFPAEGRAVVTRRRSRWLAWGRRRGALLYVLGAAAPGMGSDRCRLATPHRSAVSLVPSLTCLSGGVGGSPVDDLLCHRKQGL